MSKNTDYSLKTIYIRKKDIKMLNLASEKKGLRHYLTVIEAMTRTSFFIKGSVPIATKDFKKISKNSFRPIYDLYESSGMLELKKGLFGRVSYKYPVGYPKCLDDWMKTEGGFIKLDRELLNTLLNDLSDNELRTYIALMLISEASFRDARKDLGVMTWFKNIRDHHVMISQNTLKNVMGSLEAKGFISLAAPIKLEDRLKSRFLFCLLSQKLKPDIPEIDAKVAQSPKNCVHLKEVKFKLSNNLNQGREVLKKIMPRKKVKSDFNFYGLDKLERPLAMQTINKLINKHEFSIDQVQESVMRFSRYINSHPDIKAEYHNPVGFLVNHMTKFGEIFIEPEYWLELQHREELGKDRFKFKSKADALSAQGVDNQSLGDFFAGIIKVVSV